VLQSLGHTITDAELHVMLNEVDTNKNGQVELGEYLDLMTSIKTGTVVSNRLAILAKAEYEKALNKISVDRSGGGV
jgi:glycerol-3-phosphate dehydrogenase